MSLVSPLFLIFVTVSVFAYYLIPQKLRWFVLLVFSYIYYLAAGPKLVIFLLFSTVVTYFGGLLAEKGKKGAVLIPLLLSFGMLALVKYANFAITNVNALFGTDFPLRDLVLPLGLSFYTFQSVGYLLDVKWKRVKAERNFLHYMLFVSFFPQIMQGPIGRFKTLMPQLIQGNTLNTVNLRRGLLRICWGFFKKLVIADNATIFVDALFNNFLDLTGYGIWAVLMYGIQLYADFSGGIDVVIGIGNLFGINLDENFRQPYFAVSITDFWHRWHITLGTWMKDYLFYPISLSKWMGRFGKWCRAHMSKNMGRAFPICIANIIVFLVVGIWHGAEWHYILYGLYNGLIIAVSGLLAKSYKNWKTKLHINDKSQGWHLFMIVRTFILVTISWYLDRAGSFDQAWYMFKNSILQPHFSLGPITDMSPAASASRLAIILFGVLVIFIISVLKEKKKDVSGWVLTRPALLQIVFFAAMIFITVILGNHETAVGGFIYANF